MTTNIERAAEVIKEAFDTAMSSGTRSTWAYQIAQTLADAGLLMPGLPEPYSQDESSTSWLLNGDVGVKVNPRCAVIIEHMDVGWFALPPEDARRFADIIKAAANHAEQEQGNE